MSETLKVCQMCGKSFNGVRDQFYCPDCTKKLKSNVIRTRTCKMCGKQFDGGPRAMYCSECKPFRRRELAHIRRKTAALKGHLGVPIRANGVVLNIVLPAGCKNIVLHNVNKKPYYNGKKNIKKAITKNLDSMKRNLKDVKIH